MTTVESFLQSMILRYLKQRAVDEDIFVFKTISANIRGVPDIFILKDGRPIFVEVKSPRHSNNLWNSLSELQKIQAEKIKKSGGEFWVVTSVGEVKDLLDYKRFKND